MADSFFTRAHDLERRGEAFATATVVRIERPTSGKPGNRAIVTMTGELHGWVGGSCTKPTVIKESLAALSDGRSRLIRLSPEPDDRSGREGITDLSMTCFSGGTMEIFIEPHPPQPRLIVVGEQGVAQALAALGKTLAYHVVEVGGTEPLPEADEHLTDPKALAEWVHALTFVVVATHGDHDEIAVESALETQAPYVGLVASRKRAASIRKYLRVRGASPERLAALHAPAGIDIGARAPEEIALSILSEIVQVRRSLRSFEWQGKGSQASQHASGEAQTANTAADPICGMSVQVEGARHVMEHSGATYYFCCAGCLSAFAAEPEKHLREARR